MKSLKEQREKLLQAKLEEMADIGVKKRTEEMVSKVKTLLIDFR